MRICPRCRSRFPTLARFCDQDNTALVEQEELDRLGTTIGNYRLDSIIGRGGMGTVYRGEHVYIEKRVAVKVLHAQFAASEDAITRFLREARAASSINHPHVVDVTDFGPIDDGGVFFVMEYLDGKTLEEVIEEQQNLPLHRALNVANQIALALAAAHDRNIVHRDLKPENIVLIRKPGRRDLVHASPDAANSSEHQLDNVTVEKEEFYDFVKVLDFGIAKVLSADNKQHTLRGSIFGTPEYMSPEACCGQDVDHRSDIYSLGVILFDMLLGHPPFEADKAEDVLKMHIYDDPPSPQKVAPNLEVTHAATQLIHKAMAKEPGDRHQTMDEFRTELKGCFGSISYRRGLKPPLDATGETHPRIKRLTEEIEDWLRTDRTSLSLEQARALARAK